MRLLAGNAAALEGFPTPHRAQPEAPARRPLDGPWRRGGSRPCLGRYLEGIDQSACTFMTHSNSSNLDESLWVFALTGNERHNRLVPNM